MHGAEHKQVTQFETFARFDEHMPVSRRSLTSFVRCVPHGRRRKKSPHEFTRRSKVGGKEWPARADDCLISRPLQQDHASACHPLRSSSLRLFANGTKLPAMLNAVP